MNHIFGMIHTDNGRSNILNHIHNIYDNSSNFYNIEVNSIALDNSSDCFFNKKYNSNKPPLFLKNTCRLGLDRILTSIAYVKNNDTSHNNIFTENIISLSFQGTIDSGRSVK